MAALVDWLEAERVRNHALAERYGVPAAIPINELVAEEVTERGCRYGHRVRSVSPFALDGPIPPAMIQGENEPVRPRILYEQYGERCNVWIAGLEADAPLPQRADLLLWKTVFRYLAELPTLERPDAALARRSVEGLLDLLEHANAEFLTALPVAGLRLAEAALRLDGVTVRPLTADEIGRLAEFGTHDPTRALRLRAFRTFNRRTTERCLITVREPWDKRQQPISHRLEALALSLQLLGFDPAGEGYTESYTEPGPTLWIGGGRVPLVGAGPYYDFGVEQLEAAVGLAARIPDEVFEGPKSPKGIALYRFRSAVSEMFPSDALVDFVTALEALLLGEKEELSFKLALYGARFLAAGKDERKTIYGQLRDIYRQRSRLVHGLRPPTPDQLNTARTNARSITGRLLVKALRDGWPTNEELEDLALS